jgi:alginate O-acetyltransferase complex protein AlgI
MIAALVALTIVVHWALPDRFRGWFIAAVTIGALFYMSPLSCGLLLLSTVLLHWLAGWESFISKWRCGLLLMLFAGVFFAGQYMWPVDQVNVPEGLLGNMLLPLGMGFYCLRGIHYAVEKYRGNIPAHRFADTAQYMFFLPVMAVGPVQRFPEFQYEIQRKRWDRFTFTIGVERILMGLFQLLVCAPLIVMVDVSAQPVVVQTYVEMLTNYLQIYVLLAGVIALAVGVSYTLGVRMVEDFRAPILARGLGDFWVRWHGSVTGWCRDYIGDGVKTVTGSSVLAAFAALFAFALWHGVNEQLIYWGIYSGAGFALWQIWQKIKEAFPIAIEGQPGKGILQLISWLLTQHYFMFGLIIFTAPEMAVVFEKWKIVLFFFAN